MYYNALSPNNGKISNNLLKKKDFRALFEENVLKLS
jgi:hypothetical protein